MTKELFYEFDEDEICIWRIVIENNVEVDRMMVSPKEAVRIDESLIEQLILFGEQTYPSLFSGIRELNSDDVRGIGRKISRIRDAVRTYADLKEMEESDVVDEGSENGNNEEEVNELGIIYGKVFSGNIPISNQYVKLEDTEEIFGKSIVTNDEGFYEILDIPLGDYIISVNPDNFDKKIEYVTISSGSYIEINFYFEEE